MRKGPDFFFDELIKRHPALSECLGDIYKAYNQLIQTYRQGGKLLVFGNGGSAADAEHIVGELMKGFLKKRPVEGQRREELCAQDQELGEFLADRLQTALPALALTTHSALFTAFSNDVDADLVFAQQVYGLARKEDLVMGISTSGNSRNVVLGLYTAKMMGIQTLGLTGETGGKIKKVSHVTICVPAASTPVVQEYHLPVYHALCAAVEDYFFDD